MTEFIGHNNPPGMAETAIDVAAGVNDWLKEHPVISDADTARAAKERIDRAKLCLADLEAERRGKVDPLNKQVSEINDSYRQPRALLDRICAEVSKRLDGFITAERLRREAEAEEARRKAAEAEEIARRAEAKEAEALANAEMGELDIDILAATQEADAAFSEYEKSQRMAARAERSTHVKIGGGITGRAISQRSYETLIVSNWQQAISTMGLTEDIQTAICKSARAYRKLRGQLPPGVAAEVEKRL